VARKVSCIALQHSDDDVVDASLERMSSFLQRMQPGRGPSEQLVLDLAALGSLIDALQQVVDRINTVEVDARARPGTNGIRRGGNLAATNDNVPGCPWGWKQEPRDHCGCGKILRDYRYVAVFDFYG